MIIVTGATGQLGSAIVQALLARAEPAQVGASVRDVVKASDLQSCGVRVRQADYDAPASLRHAFEGASQVLLVSSNARAVGGDPLIQHRSAIDAAVDAGARRIVYTSHMAVSGSSAFPPMLDHFATERMLEESGVAWTALRNGFYAGSGVAMMGNAFDTGAIETPRDGAVSWTTHADLAAAAAVILTNEGQFEGATPPLTGSEALSFADVAALASECLDMSMRRVTITDDELRARLAARGAPARSVDIVLGFFLASRTGEFSAVDPTLERLIGRRPIGMRQVLMNHIAAQAS